MPRVLVLLGDILLFSVNFVKGNGSFLAISTDGREGGLDIT